MFGLYESVKDMKAIKVNVLDPVSIDAAVKALEDYKKKLDQLPDKVAQRAQKEGLERMISGLPPISDQNEPALYGTGQYGNVYTIEAGGCLPYVEFGTGVVGQGGGYPEPMYLTNVGWQYASGPHVFTTKKGRKGWFWFSNARGHFLFTEGIAPGGFMASTIRYLRDRIPEIAREELNSG